MCVIAVKTKDTPIDKQALEWLENCWWDNPDGAGFMYSTGDNVRIVKGFMEIDELLDAINEYQLDNKTVVFHFRWATHGTVCAANTHPFPLSDKLKDLQATDTIVPLAMVHNGIVNQVKTYKGMSDTMVFAKDFLAPLGNRIFHKPTQKLIGLLAGGNKFAFMSGDKLSLVGSFIKEPGWYFSNQSYLSWTWAFGEDEDEDTNPHWGRCEFCEQSTYVEELESFMEAMVCDGCRSILSVG